MQTEDDTFRALLKTPGPELDRIKDIWLRDPHDHRYWDIILAEHKWTRSEWEAYLTQAIRHDD